jgi:glutamine amidotransferase-like uncharacterized protein
MSNNLSLIGRRSEGCDIPKRNRFERHNGSMVKLMEALFVTFQVMLGLLVISEPGIALGQIATVGDVKPLRVTCLDVYGQAERGIGPKNIQRCLGSTGEFTFQTVDGEQIRNKALKEFDVLICPGGSGSRQSKALDEAGRQAVLDFVEQGGGYVGICAGAYLASSHYSWSLGILNAKVVDTAHWARGTGDVKLKLTSEGRKLLGGDRDQLSCYYGQGPLLAPGDRKDLASYQILATYDSEIAKRNAPTGVMIGTTAIAIATYGKGRVVCFSPHPEKTEGLEDFIRRAVQWAGSNE